MERNLKLLKYILPMYNAWFWLGVWLIFYLSITDYKGVGFLESSMFLIGLIIEIPTGALSDLLGRRITLSISFTLFGLGNLYMSTSSEYWQLFLSVLLMVTASALYSGTSEALIYDSHKTINKESTYDKYLALMERNSLILIGTASVIGGYLFSINRGFPFLITGLVQIFAAILIFLFITEPPIDSEKFSFKNYLKQNKEGIKQIATRISKLKLLHFLTIFGIIGILDNVLDTAYPMSLGIKEEELGILFAVISFTAAFGAWGYSKLNLKIKAHTLFTILSIVYLVTMLVARVQIIYIGIAMLLSRALLEPAIRAINSKEINDSVESKYRATALSTFAIVKGFPYVAVGILVGDWVDKIGVFEVISNIGVIGLIAMVVIYVFEKLFSNSKSDHTNIL